MKKDLVRKEFSKKRKILSTEIFKQEEKLIIEKVISEIKRIKPSIIHCFLPIKSKDEINTQPIFDYCWTKGIITVVPVSNFTNNTMVAVKYQATTKTQTNKWHIPEPIQKEIFPPNKIDLIITPLIAFDKSGYRTGYGKGFYDRFISLCNPSIFKLGVSLFDPIEKIEDINEYDIPLNSCITPRNIFTF